MTEILVTKRYQYKGVNIAIRLINRDVIEYIFPYKGHVFVESFSMETKKRKLKEIGAATIIVCNAAEKVVDEAKIKLSIIYKIKKRLGLVKVAGAAKPKDSNAQTTQKSSGEGQGPHTRSEQGPLQAAEQHRAVGAVGKKSEDGTPSGKDGVPKRHE